MISHYCVVKVLSSAYIVQFKIFIVIPEKYHSEYIQGSQCSGEGILEMLGNSVKFIKTLEKFGNSVKFIKTLDKFGNSVKFIKTLEKFGDSYCAQ